MVTPDGKVPQKPPPEIIRLSKLRSWAVACNGDPALVQAMATNYAVPNKDNERCRFRTTWMKLDHRWYHLELAVNIDELNDAELILPGIALVLITIFHASKDVDLLPFLTTTTDLVPDKSVPIQEPCERHRKTFRDAAEGTEHPSDWTRFNVGRSLKALATGSPETQMRELRKLHLRWWHCGKEAMRRVLSAAGLLSSILDKVSQVVDTCRECRSWTRPANETIPTMRMTTAFNEHVEVDLMFYKEHTIFHMICCGTRWHAACLVRSRHEEELMSAMHKIWLSTHGPMQTLISDGELGITGDSMRSKLKRLGISLKIRAPGQHARFIERRGAILRTTLHCIESQMIREGVQASMEALLSEAVFAGNALVHVGGVTPYQCIYGRTPAMLPPLPDADENKSELEPAAEQTRHKVRTIALEAMIQATSLARTSRALRSRAIAATEVQYKTGDLIDYHRPTTKDVSGWQGPVPVLRYVPEEGVVIVQINGKPKPCRLQDVRHTLFATISFQWLVTPTTKEVISTLKNYISSLPWKKYITLGLITNQEGQMHFSPATRKHGQLVHALQYLIEHVWQFDECHAVRIGKGCRTLSNMPGATHSTLLYWQEDRVGDIMIFASEGTQLSMPDTIGDAWEKAVFVQLIHNSDNPSGLCDSVEITNDQLSNESEIVAIPDEVRSDRLSTIQEGAQESEDTHESNIAFAAFAKEHFEPATINNHSDEIRDLWLLHQDTVQHPIEQSEIEIPKVYVVPDQFNNCPNFDPAEVLQRPIECDSPHLTELLVTPGMTNCFGNADMLQNEEMFSVKMYHTNSKLEVVKRASDLLTKEELVQHRQKVEEAIFEEFRIWEGYKCFEMVSRKGAQNIIDSRFVAKWKVKDPSKPYESRIIRMRMALRGFKEWCADSLDNHAATGSRASQKLLLSEAACHPEWSFLSIDINKAFLQGITYKEMSEATGQEERVVHFTVPPNSAHILRLIPGYVNYDERTHVLKCLKPGTGCKDAPKAFSMKLARVTRSIDVGLTPLAADSECEVKHKNGRLVLIVVKHVDDLKIAGEEAEVKILLHALQRTFGKSERNDNHFTCVGIKHCRSPDGTITLDQNEYINSLQTIHHADLNGKHPDDDCSEAVMRLYWSLLGAVAYTLLTQHWIAVFVIALQRQTHKPKYQHIRKLNSLVKVLQRQKANIVYPNMQCSRHIICFSDASFCKESESKGYGVRGTILLRVGMKDGKQRCHALEACSQSIKLVTRSTFSSEALAAVGSVDTMIPLAISLQEILEGPLKAEEIRQIRECSNFVFKTSLVIDARNLFDMWISSTMRLPAEKSLFPHLMWLRDVTKCLPSHLVWCDTRDMVSDGLTKGNLSRGLLLRAMAGHFSFTCEVKEHNFKPAT